MFFHSRKTFWFANFTWNSKKWNNNSVLYNFFVKSQRETITETFVSYYVTICWFIYTTPYKAEDMMQYFVYIFLFDENLSPDSWNSWWKIPNSFLKVIAAPLMVLTIIITPSAAAAQLPWRIMTSHLWMHLRRVHFLLNSKTFLGWEQRLSIFLPLLSDSCALCRQLRGEQKGFIHGKFYYLASNELS